MFEGAIELDADYAPAWAGLATVHALLYEWWGSKDEDLHRADRASQIAMELAPDLADAHFARGFALSLHRRYDEAQVHFELAARINPNLFDAYYYYGRAAFARGEIEQSVELFRKAAEVRQEDFQSPTFQAQSLTHARPQRRGARGRRAKPSCAPSASWRSIRSMAGRWRSVRSRCSTKATSSARSSGRSAPSSSIPTT